MPVSVSAPTVAVITVDGSDLDDVVASHLTGAVVVDRMSAPDMFSIVFDDPERTVLGDAGLEIGAMVEISTASRSSDELVVLIKGEVTSIETEIDALGARAVVRGYDKSHRLAAGRKTTTFQGVSYADIASTIAGDAGLTAEVDSTDGVFDHVFQVNQSDLDFLYGLARLANREFRVDGDKLLFKKAVPSADAPAESDPENATPTQLVCGDSLIEFRARMSAVGQVAKVQVRGWDPKGKAEVVGEVEATATNAEVAMTPGELADKIGGQTLVVVNQGIEDQESAERLAQARAEQIGSSAFEATGVAVGDPALKAGVAVSISRADPSLCGKWVISGSRHEFVSGVYRTALEFSGRQDRTLFGLFNQGGGAGGGGGSERVPGVVIAIVDDNNDPDKYGRVRLKYPWMGDEAVSYWARIAAPGAGKDYGMVWLPQVGDEVLVAFEHGDTNRPIVVGGLWNGTDVIPFDYGDLDNGKVTYCGWTSRTGHKISIFEGPSDAQIQLLTANGEVNVVLDDKNKEVRVETTGKIILDAQGDVEIKAGGAMKLEATGQMTIKGATVALN
jgi:uncharacterized protein involved in type VI secretion and phage assembly